MSMKIKLDTDLKKSENEWLFKAIEILKKKGIAEVKVGRIAKELNLSKKEFYLIYDDRKQLLDHILKYYHHNHHRKFVDFSNNFKGTPQDKFRALHEAVSETNFNDFESAVRRWSRRDEDVSVFMDRIDRQRLKIVKEILTEMGFNEEEAHTRASLYYLTHVGNVATMGRLQNPENHLQNMKLVYSIIINPLK